MRLATLAFALLTAAVAPACGGAQTQPTPATAGPARPAEATCPVMHNTFTPTEETEFSEYKGTTYWFCCRGCKGKFDADPEKYLASAAPVAPAEPAKE